ncbi:hypothetical protein QOZ80_1AG0007710 [Eleusine coracana subsp. coracana]|nr:hypothetical protein QOZ80_1AG0007710 [Eleusine coracana subsp. coracana]
MQLVSCEFAAVRAPVPAAWSGPRPSSLRTSNKKKPAAAVRCAASRRDDAEFGCGESGRLVDEGMVELRRRIHEMHAAERNWEPPADWCAWEKEWYGNYDADVCHLVGALQAFLLGARPGVGVGILAALVLAVPASGFVIVSHLLDAWRGLLSNLPH